MTALMTTAAAWARECHWQPASSSPWATVAYMGDEVDARTAHTYMAGTWQQLPDAAGGTALPSARPTYTDPRH